MRSKLGVSVGFLLFLNCPAIADGERIALIIRDLSEPFPAAEAAAITQRASKLGYSVSTLEHHGDSVAEVSDLARAISGGVAAIVLDSTESSVPDEIVATAREAQVPLILIGNHTDPSSGEVLSVFTDIRQCSQQAAEQLASAMSEGTNYIIASEQTSESGENMDIAVARDVLGLFPQFQMLGDGLVQIADSPESASTFRSLRTGASGPIAVLGVSDQAAILALNTISPDGVSAGTIAVGFGGSPEAAEAIRSGRLTSTVMFPVYEMADVALDVVDSLASTGTMPIEMAHRRIPCQMINQKNVGRYTGPYRME